MGVEHFLVLTWFVVCILALIIFYTPPTKEELEKMIEDNKEDEQWK